jgi:4-diphosphocytidyl-2-C-methyl-D-erythritol kinase
MELPRRAKLKAFAKINLSLLVGNRRADGYHEICTLFQTVSLADRLELEYEPGVRSTIEVNCTPRIADNLAGQAAKMILQASRAKGRVRIRIHKRIPMGGGLGGGSSDAAAVVLALPVLTGRRLEESRLEAIAAGLGSDVGFFLKGGTAIGLGRGEVLYPGPEITARHALIVVPPEAVSTAEAYAGLGRPAAELTEAGNFNRMKRFQSLVWALARPARADQWKAFCENDFEAVVFRRYPLLQILQRKLRELGAGPARMSGSGSAVFGVFASGPERDRAMDALTGWRAGLRLERVSFVGRKRYQAAFWKALAPHMKENTWPPQSRYAE